VATLEGALRVKIPPGSSTGRRIRLRGKGYPGPNGQKGDLFAEIRVVMPGRIGAEERELYERLAQVSDFDPRADQ
jgi:curved DNA-binding protein